MKRIIENISPLYLKNEAYFVERISRIVCGDLNWNPYRKDSGFRWQLDSGNNWWCTLNDNGTLEIMYRYDGGGNTEYVDAVINLIRVGCTNKECYL